MPYVTCPSCGKKGEIPPNSKVQSVRCTKCGFHFRITGGASSTVLAPCTAAKTSVINDKVKNGPIPDSITWPNMKVLKPMAMALFALLAIVGLSTAIGSRNVFWVLGTFPGTLILLLLLFREEHYYLIGAIGLLLAVRYLGDPRQACSYTAVLSILTASTAYVCMWRLASDASITTDNDLFAVIYIMCFPVLYILILMTAVLPSNAILNGIAYVNRHLEFWAQPEPDTLSSSHVTVEDMKEHVQRWKTSKEKLSVLISGLQKDREELLGRLDEIGVKSVGDAATNPRAKLLLEEFRDMLRQLALYQKKLNDYDLAVFKSESQLRTIERRMSAKEAGVSDAELADLTKNMLSLEESLSSEDKTAVPLALDDMLAKELASVRERKSQPNEPVKSRQGSEKPAK